MADYLTARAAIATIIGAVTITSPVTLSIAEMQETPTDGVAVQQCPAVVIPGYQLRYLRGPGGKRERLYTISLRLAVRPADGATTNAQLDALKEAISSAFDAKVTLGLGSGYSVIEGPNWTQEEPLRDGGTVWDEGEILVAIKDTATISP